MVQVILPVWVETPFISDDAANHFPILTIDSYVEQLPITLRVYFYRKFHKPNFNTRVLAEIFGQIDTVLDLRREELEFVGADVNRVFLRLLRMLTTEVPMSRRGVFFH